MFICSISTKADLIAKPYRWWPAHPTLQSYRDMFFGTGSTTTDAANQFMAAFRNSLLMLENNLPATVGETTARLRIFIRKVLDGCAAAAYLLTLRGSCARAVLEAHREYRELKKKHPAPQPGKKALHGSYQGLMILHKI